MLMIEPRKQNITFCDTLYYEIPGATLHLTVGNQLILSCQGSGVWTSVTQCHTVILPTIICTQIDQWPTVSSITISLSQICSLSSSRSVNIQPRWSGVRILIIGCMKPSQRNFLLSIFRSIVLWSEMFYLFITMTS